MKKKYKNTCLNILILSLKLVTFESSSKDNNFVSFSDSLSSMYKSRHGLGVPKISLFSSKINSKLH